MKPFLFYIICALIFGLYGCNKHRDTHNQSQKYGQEVISFIDSLEKEQAALCRQSLNPVTPNEDTVYENESDTAIIVAPSYQRPQLSYRRLKHDVTNRKWINRLRRLSEIDVSSHPINVFIKYSCTINGYRVFGLLNPYTPTSETAEVTLLFDNGHDEFVYKSSPYTLASFYLSTMVYDEKIKWHDGDIFEFDYISPDYPDSYKDFNRNSPIGFYSPFQLYDIDFDSKDELFINNWDCGQQGNTYSIYRINNGNLSLISDRLPYAWIDNMSIIAPKKKSIVIYRHDGCFYSSRIYFRLGENHRHSRPIPKFHDESLSSEIEKYLKATGQFRIDSVVEAVNDSVYRYKF